MLSLAPHTLHVTSELPGPFMITCTLAQSGLGRKLNTLCWHIGLQKAMKFWYYMEIFIPKPFHIALIKARKLLSLIYRCPETEDFCSSSGSCRCHAKIVMYIIPGQSSHWLKTPLHGLRAIIIFMAENLRDVWGTNACNNSTSTIWIWKMKSILMLWENGKTSNIVTEYFPQQYPIVSPYC